MYRVVVALLFLATVPFANWLVQHYGIVEVAPGLYAPAAVYVVGLAFVLRDFVQRFFGRSITAAIVLVGAALSYVVAPDFALASGVAFAVSELADLIVFSIAERRSFWGAVLASNVVGIMLDSLVFLSIAFGSLAFFWGQVVGKAWMGVVGVLILALIRGAMRRTATA